MSHPNKNKIPQTSFSTVEIRLYSRILGDNPSCSNGPPLTIDWEYNKDNVIQLSLDNFEYMRMDRLEGPDLVLSREEREEMLAKLGYTRSQIAYAVRTNIRVKNQRRQTFHNLTLMKLEEAVEKASRKIKKLVQEKKEKLTHYYPKQKEDNSTALLQLTFGKKTNMKKHSTTSA